MQSEIIALLEKQKEPLGRTEIAIILKSTPVKVSVAIRQLLKYKEVKCLEIDHYEAMKRFGCKRRVRLYYIDNST